MLKEDTAEFVLAELFYNTLNVLGLKSAFYVRTYEGFSEEYEIARVVAHVIRSTDCACNSFN